MDKIGIKKLRDSSRNIQYILSIPEKIPFILCYIIGIFGVPFLNSHIDMLENVFTVYITFITSYIIIIWRFGIFREQYKIIIHLSNELLNTTANKDDVKNKSMKLYKEFREKFIICIIYIILCLFAFRSACGKRIDDLVVEKFLLCISITFVIALMNVCVFNSIYKRYEAITETVSKITE